MPPGTRRAGVSRDELVSDVELSAGLRELPFRADSLSSGLAGRRERQDAPGVLSPEPQVGVRIRHAAQGNGPRPGSAGLRYAGLRQFRRPARRAHDGGLRGLDGRCAGRPGLWRPRQGRGRRVRPAHGGIDRHRAGADAPGPGSPHRDERRSLPFTGKTQGNSRVAAPRPEADRGRRLDQGPLAGARGRPVEGRADGTCGTGLRGGDSSAGQALVCLRRRLELSAGRASAAARSPGRDPADARTSSRRNPAGACRAAPAGALRRDSGSAGEHSGPCLEAVRARNAAVAG